MTNDPIYQPNGSAREYGNYAINIYSGCPHACFYCYVPNVLRKSRKSFQEVTGPRIDIVKRVEKQLAKGKITKELIHLCFTCDPYPLNIDSSTTREIIKQIKDSGNNVQILTKSGEEATRDFDLLGQDDWFGVTLTASEESALKFEPKAAPNHERIKSLEMAHNANIRTWVSLEPVLEPEAVCQIIQNTHTFVNTYKIGKLNYVKNTIQYAKFVKKVQRLCERLGCTYYIKEGLKAEATIKRQ